MVWMDGRVDHRRDRELYIYFEQHRNQTNNRTNTNFNCNDIRKVGRQQCIEVWGGDKGLISLKRFHFKLFSQFRPF